MRTQIELLQAAIPYLRSHQDAGPAPNGWQSDELLKLCSEVEAAVAPTSSATADQIQALVTSVTQWFRCFGGDRPHGGNPIAAALKGQPPTFAAGVDVESVVRFVVGHHSAPLRAALNDLLDICARDGGPSMNEIEEFRKLLSQ